MGQGRTKLRTFARISLVIYVLLVVISGAVAFLDPPTGRDYSGIIGLIAGFAIGLPWSLLVAFLHMGLRFGNAFGRYEDAALMWMAWACSGLNIWLLTRWAMRKKPEIRTMEAAHVAHSRSHADDET